MFISFQQTLRELRLEKKLSQKKLSEKIKFGQSTVSEWERGLKIPNMNSLKVLADFFNVSIDYLTGTDSRSDVRPSQNAVADYKKIKFFRALNDLDFNAFSDAEIERLADESIRNAQFILSLKRQFIRELQDGGEIYLAESADRKLRSKERVPAPPKPDKP
jgi:transcriptional regulator with XRE-family HTH domain